MRVVLAAVAVSLVAAPLVHAGSIGFNIHGTWIMADDEPLLAPTATLSVWSTFEASLEVSVADGAWTPYAGSVALPPDTGRHVVEARAVDPDGVVLGSARRVFAVDATPPIPVLVRPIAGSVYSDFPLLLEYPSDAAAEKGVAVFYNFGPLEGGSSDVGGAGVAKTVVVLDGHELSDDRTAAFRGSVAFRDGTHEILLRATDRLGNVAETAPVLVEQHLSNLLEPDVGPVYAPSGAPSVRPDDACAWVAGDLCVNVPSR